MHKDIDLDARNQFISLKKSSEKLLKYSMNTPYNLQAPKKIKEHEKIKDYKVTGSPLISIKTGFRSKKSSL